MRGYGCKFTWTNSHVSCKLDRTVINDSWMETYEAYARYKTSSILDHNPILVSICTRERIRKGILRHKDLWGTDEMFPALVAQAWSKEVQGHEMLRVVKRLQEVKKVLKALNAEKYSPFYERAEAARRVLDEIQSQLQHDMLNSELKVEEQKARDNYIMVHKPWRAQLQQQAKFKWIGEGDANTTFYHTAINHRRKVKCDTYAY